MLKARTDLIMKKLALKKVSSLTLKRIRLVAVQSFVLCLVITRECWFLLKFEGRE